MGSRGQSAKKQLAQLDRASDRYYNLQERADKIDNVGGRFYDHSTGREVPREDVEKLDKDLREARNKDEKTDVLVRKGREPKAQRKEDKNARMTAGDWIKNQVNVDIEKYRDSATKQFDKRGFITINWKSMPRTERAYIEQLAQKYPNRIQLFDAGAWAKQIRFKR